MQTRTPFGHLHSRFITVDPCKMFKPFDFCLTSLGCFWLYCAVLSFILASRPRAAAIVAPRLPIGRPGSLCIVPGAGSAPIGQQSSVVHLHLTTSHTALSVCTHFITLDHIWSIPTVGVESAVSVSFRYTLKYTLSSICWYKTALLPPWLAPLAGAGPADLVVLRLKVTGSWEVGVKS